MANRSNKCVMLLVGMLLMAFATPARAADAVTAKRAAQQKLLAYRAARADGIRKLAEQIRGMKLTATTTVRDFVTESDVIRTSLEALPQANTWERAAKIEPSKASMSMATPARNTASFKNTSPSASMSTLPTREPLAWMTASLPNTLVPASRMTSRFLTSFTFSIY